MFILGLVQNIALLVTLSVVQQLILRRWRRHTATHRVLSGILYGTVAIVGMMSPVTLAPGIFFDGRSIVLGISGLFGGPVVAGIAAVIAGTYRLWLGGGGVIMGVATVVESALLGVGVYYLRKRNENVVRLPGLWLFGFLIHAVMLSLTVTLPVESAGTTFRQIALPVLLVYPIATVLVGRLMLDQEERIRTEEVIRESEERYRFLAENMLECLWVVDTDLVCTYVNSAVMRLAGYTPEEWIGTKGLDYYNAENQSLLRDAIQTSLEALPEVAGMSFECEITSKDGRQVPIEMSGSVIVDAMGNPAGFQGTARDITERKLAEAEILRLNESLEQTVDERTEELQATNQELELANQSLEEANEAKTRFLRAMSHELRTPLNSIIGFSDILDKGLAGDLNDEQHRQIEMINHSGRHLLDLVNDILDLSRIEANRLEYNYERIRVAPLVRAALDTISPDAEAKGLSVVFEEGEPDLELLSDARKVQQILLNLLSNAVKFTTTGTITVRAHRPSSGIGMTTFEVEDTGPGIAPERLETIFGEFVQGGGDGYSPQEGTGLGLAISRGLALRLGGLLKLKSTVGVGSVFTLSLPDQPLTKSD